MKISVVIPTHNNAQILPECLRRILGQTLPKEEYEVLVVNDASTDNTVGVVRAVGGVRVVGFDVSSGPSAARNLGIKEAQSPLIVFIQDDIFVEPDFLERHLKFHAQHPDVSSVLVGYTRFDPALSLTPFMKWWEDGHQFKFSKDRFSVILSPVEESLRYGSKGSFQRRQDDKSYLNFYPTNLSVKKEFLVRNEMFDEEFFVDGHIGYEDTELGYRLWKAGMKLYYDPSIKVLHYHLRTLKDICDQSFYKGRLAKILYKKHPDLQAVFRDDLKFNMMRFIVNSVTIKPLEPLACWCESRFRAGPLFWLVCRYYYNCGYSQ